MQHTTIPSLINKFQYWSIIIIINMQSNHNDLVYRLMRIMIIIGNGNLRTIVISFISLLCGQKRNERRQKLQDFLLVFRWVAIRISCLLLLTKSFANNFSKKIRFVSIFQPDLHFKVWKGYEQKPSERVELSLILHHHRIHIPKSLH